MTGDPQDQAGVPLSDQDELELRQRMVVLEQRLQMVFWLAVAAEVGVIALASILVIAAWKEPKP